MTEQNAEDTVVIATSSTQEEVIKAGCVPIDEGDLDRLERCKYILFTDLGGLPFLLAKDLRMMYTHEHVPIIAFGSYATMGGPQRPKESLS